MPDDQGRSAPEPLTPEPFTFAFDSADACSLPEASDLWLELPDEITALLEGFDPSTALVDDLAYALESIDIPDEYEYIVQDVLDSAAPHESCDCSQHMWDDLKGALDDVLATLPSTLWAVSRQRDDSTLDDVSGPLSFDSLYQVTAHGLNRYNGWDEMEVVWNQNELVFAVAICGYGWDTTVLRPLTPSQVQWANQWAELDGWGADDDYASRVLATNPAVLGLVFDLLDENVNILADLGVEATEVVDAAILTETTSLSSAEREILFVLAQSWEGKPAELFDTARTVLTAA